MQLGQCDVDPLLRGQPLGLEPGRLEGGPLGDRVGLGELGGGLVDRGLHLDQAGYAGGAAGGEVGADQVALAGDRGEVGVSRRERAGRNEVLDHRDLVEQPRHRGPQHRLALDHVQRVLGAGRQRRPAAGLLGRAAQEQPRAAEILGLEVLDRADGTSADSTTTASDAVPSAAATAAS